MIQVLILTNVIDREKFSRYLEGHLPTIAQYGGKIIFRSIENRTLPQGNPYDAVVLQEWKSEEDFLKWYNSPEYSLWVALREEAARMSFTICRNLIRM